MLNLFMNLGGHGGYQILSQNFIQSLRLELDSPFSESVNLFPLVTGDTKDPYITRSLSLSDRLVYDFKNTSLAIASFKNALSFFGERRILYPMHEGTRLCPSVVAKLNLLDEIWVSSTFNKNVFIEQGVKKEKVKLLHAGIDTCLFHPMIENNKNMPFLRATGQVPISKEKPFVFLQVGKFENRKASYETIYGFLQAMEDHPLRDCVELKVKWSSSVLTRSLQEIKSLLTPLFVKYPKATPRISLVEEKDADMVSLYNSSDCFIFPSKSEGIGLPLLEAMACGIPAITTSYGSLSDYLCKESSIVLEDRGQEGMSDPFYKITEAKDGTWGVVKAEDISNAILDMIEDTNSSRYQMSIAARKHSQKFSQKVFGRKILQLLKES